MVGDARVVDAETVDIQPQRAARLGIGFFGAFRLCGRSRLGWRGAFLLRWLTQAFPVAGAVLVAVERQVEALNGDVAHLHFAAQQRHHANGEPEHAQVGEGLLRRAGAGEGGFVQFQAEPGEQAPADVAIDLQLEPGLVAGELADFILVVVGVEQVSQGEAQRNDDQQQSEDCQAQDLAERFHGRVLCVGDLESGEYSVAVFTD